MAPNGLAQAGASLGQLSAHLAIEQNYALVVVVASLGYDSAAVTRAFRARLGL